MKSISQTPNRRTENAKTQMGPKPESKYVLKRVYVKQVCCAKAE